MAINRARKFQTIDQVQVFLNGGIVGSELKACYGPPGNQAPGVLNLVGKTLIFVGPGPTGTVTFVASSGSNPDPNVLQLKDISAQIVAAIATLKVNMLAGALTIQEATPASGVTVSSAGTANTILGFDTLNNTVGKFYAPPGAVSPIAAPCWTWINSLSGDNALTVLTYE
jgi:hypothetical protein